MKRIVIVGAGFVGLRVARLLCRRSRNRFTVVLIDKKKDFLFTPWLIDVLSGEMNLEDITAHISAIAQQEGFVFVEGEVGGIDREKKCITIRNGAGPQDMAYDVCVLSHGVRTCYYGIPGAEEYSYPLKTPGDAKRAQDAILRMLREAEKTADPKKRETMMNIAVAGAGPSGIESVFAVKKYIETLQQDGIVDASLQPRYHLIQAAPQILPGFPEAVVRIANTELDRNGIQTMTGEAVTQVEEGRIHTISGKMIPVSFVLWTAGIEPLPLSVDPTVETDRGYPVVDNFLRLDESVFCAGDMSGMKMKGAPVPKTAQTAMQMAENLAANILKWDAGARLRPFRAETKGVILTLGETGTISFFHRITIKTSLANLLRKLFYRFRFKQMTGA